MTDSAALADALRDYEAAIHALAPADPDLHQAILTALTQRDAIQAMLNDAAFVPASQLTWLDALDEKLKSQKTLIVTTIDQGKWRSLLHIPTLPGGGTSSRPRCSPGWKSPIPGSNGLTGCGRG